MFGIAALVIVLLNRRSMLTREGAVTEVLLPGEEGSSDAHRQGFQNTEWESPDRMEV